MQSHLISVKKLIVSGRLHESIARLDALDFDTLNSAERVEFFRLQATASFYLQQFEQAQSYIQQWLRLSAKDPNAWQLQGQLYRKLGETQSAVNSFNQAVSLNWAMRPSWQALSELYRQAKNSDSQSQILWCERFLALFADLPNETYQTFYASFGDNKNQALKTIGSSLNRHNGYSQAVVSAIVFLQCELYIPAESILAERLAESEGKDILVRYLLAQVYANTQEHHKSLQLAEQLTSELNEVIPIEFLLANQRFATGQYDSAKALYQMLVRRFSNFEQAWLNLGHLGKTIGDLELAISSYKQAINNRPSCGDAYWSLANLKQYRFSEQQITDMKVQLDSDLLDEDRTRLYFALGYALEREKDVDRAFDAYVTGNALKSVEVQYTPDVINSELSTAKLPDWKMLPKLKPAEESLQPIFIVGMPRAGSTLLEQILACHSQITATFELPYILSIAKKLNLLAREQGAELYGQICNQLTVQQLIDFRQEYLDRVEPFAIKTPFFVDKMPNNFRHLGLILSLFPNAKIIDIRRDKMACCFSNFKQLYGRGQEFSYNWQHLSHYYDSYIEFIEHWQGIYPRNMMTLHYEKLVAEPKTEIRRVLEFLELNSEKACFNHHSQVSTVRTASAEQVRKPINQGGVDYWRRYETQIIRLAAQG